MGLYNNIFNAYLAILMILSSILAKLYKPGNSQVSSAAGSEPEYSIAITLEKFYPYTL